MHSAFFSGSDLILTSISVLTSDHSSAMHSTSRWSSSVSKTMFNLTGASGEVTSELPDFITFFHALSKEGQRTGECLCIPIYSAHYRSTTSNKYATISDITSTFTSDPESFYHSNDMVII